MEVTIRGKTSRNGEKQIVPCGKCGACLYNRVEDWTIRLVEENRVALNAWFVTLTYEDAMLPLSVKGIPQLHKPDYQKFLKRLRTKIDRMSDSDYRNEMLSEKKPVRYYAVGEYGGKTKRPHYHLIMFNVPVSCVESMHTIWQKGHVHIGEVNSKSIAYCVSYHVTAKYQEYAEKMEVTPEFATMSRNPGIGHTYFQSGAIQWHRKNGLRSLLGLDIKSGFLAIIKSASLMKKRGHRLLKSADYYRQKQWKSLGTNSKIMITKINGLSTRICIPWKSIRPKMSTRK